MEDSTYRALQEHLDRLPGGFPPSTTGADLVLLRRLFAVEEAALAVHLTLVPEEARTIATRADLDHAEAEMCLEDMARKGLIFSVRPADGPPLYQAAPFVVGIYEFQVNNLSPELLQAFWTYWRTGESRPPVATIPQMRTTPIGKSVEPHLEALPYERVEVLVASQNRFAVAPCICRRSAKMVGAGCDAPEESCLIFGEWADYYVAGGRARYVDRSELRAILTRADEANLVLQPSNSTEAAFICCCCGCCCGVLAGLKRQAKPADAVASAFIAHLDADACTGCWTCLERCQMQAFTQDGGHVVHDPDRCIGCGLCVTTCPSDALTLVRKSAVPPTPPADMNATWKVIAEAESRARGHRNAAGC